MEMQVKQYIILLLLFQGCLTVNTQENQTTAFYENPAYDFPYQLAEPDQSWKLPNSLMEISGLGFVDDDRLACIQDEKGIIFIFNLKTGKVELETGFSEDGDYEGIEIIEKDAWVLRSNGTLYRVTGYLEMAGTTTAKYPTALSGKNNTEGLAYDPVNRSLLIACKGHPYIEKNEGKDLKAIYSFSLENKQLSLKPFLLIDLDTVRYYKNYDAMTRLGVEIMAYTDPSEGDETFQPSGIAIHPASGDIYILGSVGKLLLVFSGKGEMLAMISLSRKVFPQPEGICFSPDGKLYISNEGDGQHGTILRFAPR